MLRSLGLSLHPLLIASGFKYANIISKLYIMLWFVAVRVCRVSAVYANGHDQIEKVEEEFYLVISFLSETRSRGPQPVSYTLI